MIRFELPAPLPLLNELLRVQHWGRSAARKRMAWEVLAAIGRQRPAEPLARVRIRVERHSTGTPDQDNLSAKNLLDVLQPPSKRHPSGLGIIAGDDPAHLRLELVAVRVATRTAQKTVVLIELD